MNGIKSSFSSITNKYDGTIVSEDGSKMRVQIKLMPTTFLVTVNIIVYVFTSLVGGNFIQTDYRVLLQLGQFNLSVFNGNYWQLLTSIFVHVDLPHIALNMLFLVIFGLRAEELFKTEEYFLIYLLSGLSGSLLTLIFMTPTTVSAGASGAVFGMYGAGILYTRKMFGQSIIGTLLYSFLFLILSTGVGINVVAHFGGLAAGLVIGYTLAEYRYDTNWLETY